MDTFELHPSLGLSVWIYPSIAFFVPYRYIADRHGAA